ncbi:hypothetical protein ACK3TF_003986 [Chlorella vulgaris]
MQLNRLPDPASHRQQTATTACTLSRESLTKRKGMPWHQISQCREGGQLTASGFSQGCKQSLGVRSSYLARFLAPHLAATAENNSIWFPQPVCIAIGQSPTPDEVNPFNFSFADDMAQASDGAADANRPLVIASTAHHLPCRRHNISAPGDLTDACCPQSVSHRLGTTDFKVFQQIFQLHYMRYLYALFPQPPQYILDAGANAGFSTLLFKLLWPDAVVVSLEPDPSNFAMLQANTKQFEGVYALQAGLWGRAANITVTTTQHDNWGRIFGEAQLGQEGMPAFSVQDVAAKFDIPAFDFMKIDIEGAEGMVFASGGDFSWISQAKVVSMELHDYFSGYFGLGEPDAQPVSRRVEAAFKSSGYSIATDNEHVMYIQPQHLQAVLASQTGSLAQAFLAGLSAIRGTGSDTGLEIGGAGAGMSAPTAAGLGPETRSDGSEHVVAPAAEASEAVTASRVGRLLLQRLRKSQSTTVLYGEPENALEQLQLQDGSSNFFPQVEGGGTQRLIVVANRLPVSAYKDRSGRWQLQVSAGGLVSALMGVGNFQTKWIGWPGVYIEAGPERDELTAALHSEGYSPVYLDQKTCDLHYNGFCNSVLWQLFHYVPLNIDVVLQHYQDGDIVWVQDYHLMLLPAMLKEVKPRMKVGFFLHTPFPSSEIYRTLPVREELLRSVLKADLIGFHTYDYARHFVSACTRILGLEGTPAGVEDNGSLTRVAAFPIGIDPDRFTEALETPEVKANIAQLLNRYAGRKVMLGVDRLDMIKGIPQKLLAFEKFLEEFPEWRDKVLLVQIAVPSRTDVPEYQRLRSMVHEVVGRINGQYGTLTHVPIYHLDRQLSFNELVALYAITDVALVTSLRDGMNLVSYEYVACQRDNAGVLILSEFAGAAQSLGAGAILVNPWNINDLSQAIEYALMMSDHERRERHRQNYMHVTIHTAQTWADTFISELNDTHVEAELRTRNIPPALDTEALVAAYRASRRRLLVLGYNATLTTAVEAPRQPKKHFDQIQALTRVNPAAYSCLAALSQNPLVDIVVISGGEKHRLEEVFSGLHIWLAAENGAVVRPAGSKEWVTMMDAGTGEWKESVQLVFEYFCERTPRSFVEQRGTSLVWNYKYADVEFGRIQARDLLQHLLTGPISNAPVDIVRGSKSVEVRPVGVSKGASMERLLQYMAGYEGANVTDFVFVGGHFLARDENVFTIFEGQEPGAGSAAAVQPRADALTTLLTQGLDQLPAAITPGRSSRTATLTASGSNLAALPEGEALAAAAAQADGPGQQQAAAAAAAQQAQQAQQAAQPPPPGRQVPSRADNGRQRGPGGLPRSGGSAHGSADDLPFKLPPKYLFTCTVGRSMASRASYSLGGSMEVAMLLHKMAMADGIPASQLHMPGLSTSASFDDLLHQLMVSEANLPPSL